jgi:hypothetical protein
VKLTERVAAEVLLPALHPLGFRRKGSTLRREDPETLAVVRATALSNGARVAIRGGVVYCKWWQAIGASVRDPMAESDRSITTLVPGATGPVEAAWTAADLESDPDGLAGLGVVFTNTFLPELVAALDPASDRERLLGLWRRTSRRAADSEAWARLFFWLLKSGENPQELGELRTGASGVALSLMKRAEAWQENSS